MANGDTSTPHKGPSPQVAGDGEYWAKPQHPRINANDIRPRMAQPEQDRPGGGKNSFRGTAGAPAQTTGKISFPETVNERGFKVGGKPGARNMPTDSVTGHGVPVARKVANNSGKPTDAKKGYTNV